MTILLKNANQVLWKGKENSKKGIIYFQNPQSVIPVMGLCK